MAPCDGRAARHTAEVRVGQSLIWAHVYPHLEAGRVSGILTHEHEPIHRWSCKLRSARGWRSTERGHVTSASLHCLSGPLGTLVTCRTLGHFYHLTFWVTCCHMNCKLFTRLTSPLSSVCGGSAAHTPSLTAN